MAVIPIVRGGSEDGVPIIGEPARDEGARNCSFCGRDRRECKVVVWSQEEGAENIGICDTCVGSCVIILLRSVLAYDKGV